MLLQQNSTRVAEISECKVSFILMDLPGNGTENKAAKASATPLAQTTDGRAEDDPSQRASQPCLPKTTQNRPHAASYDAAQRFAYLPVVYETATTAGQNAQGTCASVNVQDRMHAGMPSNQTEYWAQPTQNHHGQYYAPNPQMQQSSPMYLQSSQQPHSMTTNSGMQAQPQPQGYLMSNSSPDIQYSSYPRPVGPTVISQPRPILQQQNVNVMPASMGPAQEIRQATSPPAAGYQNDSSGTRYQSSMTSAQHFAPQTSTYQNMAQPHAGAQSAFGEYFGVQNHYPAQQYGYAYAPRGVQSWSSGVSGTAQASKDTVEMKKRGNEWTGHETIALLLFTQLMLDCDLKTISQALFSYISRAPGKSSGRAAEKKLKRMKIFKNWKGANKIEVQHNIDGILQHYGVFHRKVSSKLEHVAMSFKDAETTGTLNQLIEFYAGTEGTGELFEPEQPGFWPYQPPS